MQIPALAVIMAAGLLLRLLIAYMIFPGEGLGSDLRLYGRWAQTLVAFGPAGFYAHAGFADYPPGYLWVLWLLGSVGNGIAGMTGETPGAAIAQLVKLPAILADLGVALLLYRAASSWHGRRAGLVAASLYLFIPVTWYDSALWGQVDAVGALLLLGAVLLLIAGWSEPAAAVAVLAAVTKPQYAIGLVVVGAVLLGRHLFRPGSGPVPLLGPRLAGLDRWLGGWFTTEQGFGRLVSCAFVAAVVGIAVILPFDLPAKAAPGWAGLPILGSLSGLAAVIGSAAQFYAVLTANALNFWALVGPNPLAHALGNQYGWTYDSLTVVGGLQAVTLGALLLIAVTLVVAAALLVRDDRETIVLGLTVLAVAFFALPTRVHERYLFPAFGVGALLAVTSIRWRWWYVALGIANAANLHAILTLPQPGYGTPAITALPLGGFLRAEPVVWVIALAHTTLFGVVLVALIRGVPWPVGRLRALPGWSAAPRPGSAVVQRRIAAIGGAARVRAGTVPPTGNVPPTGAMPPTGAVASRGQGRPSPAWALAAVLGPIRRRLDAGGPPEDRTAEIAVEGHGRIDRRDLVIALALVAVTFGMRTFRLDTPRSMYFDESFYPRTAMEFLQDWRYGIPHDIWETTHPPLSKYIIAGGIVLFGNNRVTETVAAGGPVRDAAIQPALVGAGGEPGGDRLAIATGSGVRIAPHADLAKAVTVALPGAAVVAFDPIADRLYVGTDGGVIWSIEAATLAAADAGRAGPAPVRVADLGSPVRRLWATGGGRVAAYAADQTLRTISTHVTAAEASVAVPGLRALVPIIAGNRSLAVLALPSGLREVDLLSLETIADLPMATPPVDAVLVEGSAFLRRNRDMLPQPTLYVTTGASIQTVTVDADGTLKKAGLLRMPGAVSEVQWDRSTNNVHVLGSTPGGKPTIYVVMPLGDVVYADAELPFAPTAWVLDVQPTTPQLDRQRALVFSSAGAGAVVDVGSNAFAWRILGVLAGSLMAGLLYLLARMLFRRRTVGYLLAIILALDGLLFAQARIAMNDSYLGFFIVAAFTLLAWLLDHAPGGARGRWLTGLGLPLVGILLGLALGTKWVGAYAIGGAVLVVLFRSSIGRWLALGGMLLLLAIMGWQAIAATPPNYAFPAIMVGLTMLLGAAIVLVEHRPAAALPTDAPAADAAPGEPDGSITPGAQASSGPRWADPRRAFGIPFGLALACLTLIPLAVYVLTFVPWALSAGGNPQLFDGWPAGHTGQTFAQLQVEMYRYHNELRRPHGLSSPWWSWPLDLKPIWGYYESWSDGTGSLIMAVGNPVLHWLSIPAVAFGAWQAWRRRSPALLFVLVAFLALWLPWSRIDRVAFDYHYYTALPFAFVLLAYFLAELWEGPSRRTWHLARVAFGVVLLFPALLWIARDPLCALAGVSTMDPAAFACTRPLSEVALPVIAWLVGALVLGWLVLGLPRPRQLVAAVLAAFAVAFVALYPGLAAMRLPGAWVFIFQGLLPSWDGSFLFSSNTAPASTVPLLGVGPLAVLGVGGTATWWAMRRARDLVADADGDGDRDGPDGPPTPDEPGWSDEPRPDDPRGPAEPRRIGDWFAWHTASESLAGVAEPAAEVVHGPPAARDGEGDADHGPTRRAEGWRPVQRGISTIQDWMGRIPSVQSRLSGRFVGWGRWPTLTGLILVSLAAALVADRFAGPNGPWLWNYDTPTTMFPMASWFHEALVRGSLPLWNDKVGLGFPIYADQIGAFYPPNWLIYQLSALQALDLSRIVHLTAAGVGTGLLVIRMTGSRVGGVTGAVATVLCGGIVSKLMWTNVLATFAWMPWILLILLQRRPRPTGWQVAAAGVAWGLQALAGHPPYWVLTGIACAVIILSRTPTRRGLSMVVAFGLVGAMVGAAQLVPIAVLTTLSVRAGGLDPEALFRFSATPFDFLGLAFGNAFVSAGSPAANLNESWYPPGGVWALIEVYSFIGLPVLAMAAIGLRHSRSRALLVLVLVMAAIPILGAFQPAIWAAVPGLNGLRHPVRAYLIVDLALAIAAGVGVARLRRAQSARIPATVVGVAIAAYGLVAALVLLLPDVFAGVIRLIWPTGTDVRAAQALAATAMSRAWPVVFEITLGGLALIVIARWGRTQLAQAASVVLVALPLVLLVPTFNQSQPAGAFSLDQTALVARLRSLDPHRVLSLGVPFYGAYPDQLEGGVPDLTSNSSLDLGASRALLAEVTANPAGALPRAVGIDTIASFGAACPAGVEAAFDKQFTVHICRLDALRTPYWMPSRVVRLPSAAAGGPFTAVDVRADAEAAIAAAVPTSVVRWDTSQGVIDVQAPAQGFVFIDRAWWPSWQVSVDGVAVTPYRLWAGQLVPVGAGRHRIEEHLVPLEALLGALISLLSLLALGAARWAWLRRRARTALAGGGSPRPVSRRPPAVDLAAARAWIASRLSRMRSSGSPGVPDQAIGPRDALESGRVDVAQPDPRRRRIRSQAHPMAGSPGRAAPGAGMEKSGGDARPSGGRRRPSFLSASRWRQGLGPRGTTVGLALMSLLAALIASRVSLVEGRWLWNFDTIRVDVPLAAFFHDALREGRLPLWNDQIRLGYPLYAEGQIGAFYPPNWLIYLLPPLQALDVSRVLHLALAGVGAGLITLRLCGSRLGALGTALIAVLCGGIAGKLEWTNVVVVYGWMPLVLLPLVWRRAVLDRRLIIVAAMAWGIQALGGHPPYWVLTGLAATVVILVRSTRRAGLARVVAFGCLGVAGGAIQVIPTAVLTLLAHRAGGLDQALAFEFSATPFDFLGLAFANAYVPAGSPAWDLSKGWYPGGFWAILESYAYVGLPALALASLGLGVRRARLILVLAGLAIVVPLIGALQLPFTAPIFSMFRHPIRSYLLLDLAIAIGAGVGLARLRGSASLRPALIVVGAAIAGYLLVMLLAVLPKDALGGLVGGFWQVMAPGQPDAGHRLAASALRSTWPVVLEVVLAGLALLVLGVARRAAVGARIVVVRLGAVALAAMPMALLVPAINQSLPASSFSLAGTSIDAALRQAAPAAILTIAEPYGPALDTILGQTAFSKRHLFSTQLAVTFELEAEGNLINNLRSKPDSALARAIGIDTIISYRGGSCPGQVLARLPENGGTTICRLDDAARPPYWVPASARLGTPARPTSLLGPADANVAAATDLQSAVPASVLNWDAGGASMIIVAPAAGYVFIDRSWWPAWQVSVDGQAVAVDRVWGGQLIAVPAGRHSIEERFVPWDILIGAALTIGGLVGGGLLAGRPLAGRQRRRWQGVFPRGLRGTQGR